MVVRWLDADPQHMREYLALRKLHDITLWQEKPAATVDKKKWLTLPYIREFIKIAAIFPHSSYLCLFPGSGERKRYT